MVQQRTSKRVVIVGGGIAGPVLGMFLKRVGIDAVVCEQRSRDTITEGLFLGVAPNGMNVLAELDLARHVEAVSLPCHGFEFRNARDQVIATIDRANDRAHFGSRLQMIRRSDLHEALTAAAGARGVAMQFGRTLVAIDRSRPA
jgi:FAD-dependent urate hydroxylase